MIGDYYPGRAAKKLQKRVRDNKRRQRISAVKEFFSLHGEKILASIALTVFFITLAML